MQWLSLSGNEQVLNDTICISHSTNIIGKKNHQTILSQAKKKVQDILNPLTLVWQPIYEKENF